MYEFGIFGCPTIADRETLQCTIERMIAEFGLAVGQDVRIFDASNIANRDRRVAFAAIYFGTPNHHDVDAIRTISNLNIPIIPTIASSGDFDADIPDFLKFTNVLRRHDNDPHMNVLCSVLLECVGLLRSQRKLFLSYRRIESCATASQLHDLLTARGFDVFLDTHDIRPGDPFQEVLWHRLCDSDAMVMLDTPTYFSSKWTRQEIGRAMAKGIHVLRVVWPEHQPSRTTDLSETIYLNEDDLERDEGPIVQSKVDLIAVTIEQLRARSIAFRYRTIIDRFRIDVKNIGATIEGIGPNRAIALRLSDNRIINAYPVVGIPTAELLYEVESKDRHAGNEGKPVLIYDHVGIRKAWNAHLEWLDERINTVQAIPVAEAAWSLAAWET